MTKWQRIKSVLSGLVMIPAAALLSYFPEYGLVFIVLIIGVSAAVRGTGKLVYYFSMARYMVGGKNLLFQGIIYLDFGIFTIGFADIPARYIMIFLLIGYVFYGLIDIMRAMEIRRRSTNGWRFKFALGLGNLALAIICIAQMNSTRMTVYIYSLGMLFSAVGKIITAFRKSALIYVQQN